MINNFYSIEKVFFLGAGFSKAINHNYPLLPELTEKIKTKIIKSPLAKYYEVIHAKVGENIEELLTYLSLDLPWKTEYTKALEKALFIDITKNISAAISSPNAMPDKYDQDQVRLLADFIIENRSLCLTLNYDILLEKIVFSRKGEKYQKFNGYEGFYKVPIQSISDRWKIPTTAMWRSGYEDPKGEELPTILKLHGSVNWMWAGISPSDPIYCSGKDTNSKEIDFFHSTLDLQHFIVPPALDKSSFYNNIILKSIWSLAYMYLGLSKEIYIIGFSLPDSDISIKYFFKEVVSRNKKMNKSSNEELKIYVINTDTTDELKERYRNVFPKENLNFDYCCEYAFDRFVKEKLSHKNQLF
jgi:hypothetical protein